jgi:hypothetical protein
MLKKYKQLRMKRCYGRGAKRFVNESPQFMMCCAKLFIDKGKLEIFAGDLYHY